MNTALKTAIVLGATGLTGNLLLGRLLNDPRYALVLVFSRSDPGIRNGKLRVRNIDLLDLSAHKNEFFADEVYCCIGTTKAQTSDRKMYSRIDYGIPVAAARLCRENQIPTLVVISAMGSNPKSRIFYSRIKGEMEEEVIRTAVPKTHILRPALISGKRREKRFMEWVAAQAMNVLNLVLAGSLKKYRSVAANDIAICMIWLANNPFERIRIRSDEITEIADKHRGDD